MSADKQISPTIGSIPPTKIKGHEFIEVGDRRWCLSCDLFQTKPHSRAFWWEPNDPCPRTTPYAINRDKIGTETASVRDVSGGTE